VGAQRIENSPDLALILETFLLNLFGRIGIDRLPMKAIDLESHGKHFSDSCSGLDVARAATVHPVLERLLNGGGAHCHAAGLAIDHVGSDVLEGEVAEVVTYSFSFFNEQEYVLNFSSGFVNLRFS